MPLTDSASHIAATLEFLHPGDDEVFEVCLIAPAVEKSPHWEGRAFGSKSIVAGWFRDKSKAQALLGQVKAAGIYVTLNPCQEALLSRACERLKANAARSNDTDIAALRNLLVDIDPIRPAGVSSSDAEHEAALDFAREIKEPLTQGGWPEPLLGDSGNGSHLIYPLELDNTPANVELLKTVLGALTQVYADPLAAAHLALDLKVFNPSRISKVYGTKTGKGDHTPARPHRWAKIVSLPKERQAVTLEQLQAMAGRFKPPAEQPLRGPAGSPRSTGGGFDLPAYLTHYGVEVREVKQHGSSTLYVLESCLFDPGHGAREAAIGQAADGKMFYQCFHNSCQDRIWAEARERISGRDSLKQFVSGGRGGGAKKKAPEKPPPPAGPSGDRETIWWVGHGYFIEGGRLCLETYDRQGMPQTRPLANFTLRITEEVIRDDGGKCAKEFHLTGHLDNGRQLPPVKIPADKFESLAWVKRDLGAAAAVAPGRSLAPHLVNAIQAHSQDFQRRTVYGHSGWRKIGGAWCYLTGGGAIGHSEPVEVDLGENLQLYSLPAPGGTDAALASLAFLDVAPWEVTAPLLACCFLAPFADLCKIDFSLWLYGPTGAMKSTLAALALCHFGAFDRRTLPGSWFSTVNSLERLCFTLKDSMIVIDDFMPAASAKDFHGMTERAGRLIYQAGNRSGRGRLAPDLSARPNYFPRGLIVSTGEVLLPGQRQSATARYLGVELDPKKTPIDREQLTAAQGESHLYAAAMSAFINDLAPRLEEVQEEMHLLFETYRGAFRNGSHARIPEVQSWLAIGFDLALRFYRDQGAITEEQQYDLAKRAWRVWESLGAKHSRLVEGERPTLKFLSILSELFLTSRVYCESREYKGASPPNSLSLGWEGSEPAKNAFLVGYADETTVFLLPETALRVVSDALRAQGDFLSLSRNDLWTALAREGFINPGTQGRNSRSVRIQGGRSGSSASR